MIQNDYKRPPFRADHVGSLLRPKELHEAREQKSLGQISDTELREVEDKCISYAVKKQEETGMVAITDGEFRRTSWHYDFLCGLEGIEQSDASTHQGPAFQGGQTINSLTVGSKISNPTGVMLDHFNFLKKNTTKTPKFCIPSPSLAYHRGGRQFIDESIYPEIEEFWEDLCLAYRDEVALLSAAGCNYLQLDDTTFAMLCDPKVREQMDSRGDDPTNLINTYGAGIAKALSGRPKDMTVTVHMCRGNNQSSWIAEGGYEPVAEEMFSSVPVDGFFMEWDTDRAGDFEPFRFAPKDKMIVLGLVSSKFSELEGKDFLKKRIEEASKYVPLENLCISPQCGFASVVAGNKITEDDQWRKLSLVSEVAMEVWG